MYIKISKLSTFQASTLQQGGALVTFVWGMRRRERVGGGNAVIFASEPFFRPSTGRLGSDATNGQFSHSAHAGLAGEYGSFKLGEQTNSTRFNQQLINQSCSWVAFSPLVAQLYTASYSNMQLDGGIWQNAVEYMSSNHEDITRTAIHGVSITTWHQGRANIDLYLMYLAYSYEELTENSSERTYGEGTLRICLPRRHNVAHGDIDVTGVCDRSSDTINPWKQR
ncbi:hypothetical protein [Paraburkholderia sp. GAS32]|uniref:hypothetical protein n=1 Tax=Paraburkholderia sp. GAS32 TaxID=3035129 RepID=UPI003D191B0F